MPNSYILKLLVIPLIALSYNVSTLIASDNIIRENIEYANNNKSSSKLSPLLNKLLSPTDSQLINDPHLTISTKNSNPLIKVDDAEYVHIYLYLKELDQNILYELEEYNLQTEIINEDLKIIQGWIPKEYTIKLSQFEFVEKITPPIYGFTRQGSVVTEGDTLINSDTVREELGITGAGVKIGVISNGVDSLSSSQATGDLPDNICVIDPGDGDEGTAMLEIIHDTAPGADLAFSDGFSSSLAFIKAIDDLINICDVDIIVDDIGFLLEPFFQDGAVAQKVDEAVSKGVVFVSAAGNSAQEHYQKVYFDEDIENDELNLHDFGLSSQSGSSIVMPLLVGGNQFSPNNFIAAVLQWDDLFGTSTNDYDLFLLDDEGNVLDTGTSIQDGDDDPIEVVVFENNSSDIMQVNLVINRFSGEPKILELYFNGTIAVLDFNVPEDSIFGHPAAEGSLAVGAVSVNKPNIIQDFSSLGPVTIIGQNVNINSLNTENNSLGFTNNTDSIILRPKPGIVGPDGVNTSVTGFAPALGTSIAAPPVAAVVALMLEANTELLFREQVLANENQFAVSRLVNNVDDVVNILKENAVDLGPPGNDNIYGAGRVDALAAVMAVLEQADDNMDNDMDQEPPDQDNMNNQEQDNDGQQQNDNSSGGCSIQSSNDINIDNIYSQLLAILILLSVTIKKRIRKKLFY